MIIFLLGRVKLNMTLVVIAAGALYRSGAGHGLWVLFKIFCYIFAL